MKKRVLAFFLAGMMAFTVAPGEAFAASSDAGMSAVSETEGSDEPAEMKMVQQEKKDLDESADLKPVEELEDVPENVKFPAGGIVHPEAYQIDETETEALGIASIQELRRKGTDGISSGKAPSYGSQKYDSSWDIYSSNYIYNRLSSKERQLWDDMNDICNDYLVNNVNTTSIQGNKFMIPPLDYKEYGLSRKQMENVFIMFLYSNPQYYFVEWYGEEYRENDFGGRVYTGVVYLSCYSAFDKGSARKSETAKMKRQIDAMEAKIAKGKNEQQKAQIAHDLIMDKVMYDPGFDLDNLQNSKPYTLYHQSAYSVFCDEYTVCAGYTKAFELLMNGAGVDTIAVTSPLHAWNIISINDSWYHVDCTWDDNLTESPKVDLDKCYIYFNRSTKMITGKLDQDGMHKMESFYTGRVPKCTLDSGATASSPGSCKNPSVKTAKPQLSQKLSGSKVKVTLSTTTKGAEIYYTTDGKNPSSSFSKSSRYTGAFTVKPNTTVKAIAVCDTKKDSDVLSVKVSGKTYTVKFDTKGGNKMSSKKVAANTVLQKPSAPKRKNYSFEGWYTDKNCKKKYDFKKKVTKNFTLYAKWKKVTVKTPAIQKLSNLSGKKMKVQIKGVSGAKGYEIRYALNSKMKSAKYTTTTSKSKTITKMKKNKTYYVQVRAYKKDSAGKKVNGSWSKTKTIEIKK